MKARVFIIDEDEGIRSMIALICMKKGYEVLSYSEPFNCHLYLDEECKCPREHACGDIFIIDMRMAKATGIELVERQARKGCKAVTENKALMSDMWKGQESKKVEKLKCGMLRKPFEISQIMDWLDDCEGRIPSGRKLTALEELFK